MARSYQELLAEAREVIPEITVAELADFCVFLCSPRASYSVGSAYHVDGGMLKTT